MKTVFQTIALTTMLAGFATIGFAAEKTWTGKISDASCGANHAKMMAEHKDAKTERDCVGICIKGGDKYVFVSGGKVYQVSNQDLAALAEHAGHTVRLTGEMTGDSIAVSKIAMPAKKTPMPKM